MDDLEAKLATELARRDAEHQAILLARKADEAFAKLQAIHDAIPDTPRNLALRGLAFAALNDTAKLARRLREG